jgi:signal transduction histidine kinase
MRHGVPPVRIIGRAAEHDTTEIRVTDAGSGVSEVMRSRLFDRFATGRTKGGTGLGLFIVRELARAQSGDATYEPPSATDPAGSFVITLPCAPDGPR